MIRSHCVVPDTELLTLRVAITSLHVVGFDARHFEPSSGQLKAQFRVQQRYSILKDGGCIEIAQWPPYKDKRIQDIG